MPEKEPGFWILKTDPETYAFDDLLRKQGDVWDGVRNAAALKHLRGVSKGDLALIYHTGGERALVGLARVTRSAYPDPNSDDPRHVVVDIAAETRLPRPVSLHEIKDDSRYRDFELVRIGRLSVMPVPAALWKDLLEKSGLRST